MALSGRVPVRRGIAWICRISWPGRIEKGPPPSAEIADGGRRYRDLACHPRRELRSEGGLRCRLLCVDSEWNNRTARSIGTIHKQYTDCCCSNRTASASSI